MTKSDNRDQVFKRIDSVVKCTKKQESKMLRDAVARYLKKAHLMFLRNAIDDIVEELDEKIHNKDIIEIIRTGRCDELSGGQLVLQIVMDILYSDGKSIVDSPLFVRDRSRHGRAVAFKRKT